MRVLFMILAMLAFLAPAGADDAPFADPAFQPPILSKSLLEAQTHPLPQTLVDEYLDHWRETVEIDLFAGQNAWLKKQFADYPLEVVGEHLPLDVEPEALFLDYTADADYYVFIGAFRSEDAHAVRLEADLNTLAEDEELWVVDPVTPRAFGPYDATPPEEGSTWLPVIEGDTAVLLVRSARADTPRLWIKTLSHIFEPLAELKAMKALACNINIACETRSGLLDVAAAVGLLFIDKSAYTGVCTGALLNTPNSAEFDPLMLTAHHCVGSAREARNTEVVWDYRATECGANDAPSINSLPRSDGRVLINADDSLDMTLLRLRSVPSGSYGRTYAGWDARKPQIGESVAGIHHPAQSHMRISYGGVTRLDQTSSQGYEKQTRVLWDEGVTEGGSSGSPLVYEEGTFRILGALSNGPAHSCNNGNNWDNYGTFHHFFPSIEKHLLADSPIDVNGNDEECPARTAFKDNPAVLENLRRLRDEGLLDSPLGKRLVDAYYRAAPAMSVLVRENALARTAFRFTAWPFAYLGAQL